MKVNPNPFLAGLLLPGAFSTAVKRRHSARVPKASLLNEALKHRTLLAQTQGDLCQNLYPLEVHMTTDFRNLFGFTEEIITIDYTCACNVDGTTLDITCSGNYDIDESSPGTTIETAKFEAVDGFYQLVQTTYAESTWGDVSVPFETYNFEGGVLSSCEMTDSSCISCSLCENSNYVAIDCSAIDYFVDCSYNYTGAFANTFDFGDLTASSELTPDTPETPEKFCSEVSDLENFLRAALKDLFTPSSSVTNVDFGCICTAVDEKVNLECSTDYVLDGTSYSSIERALLEAKDGIYELVQTSYSDSAQTSQSPNLDIPVETYNFEGGQLSSCEASNCTSCTLCENRIHVAVDCESSNGWKVGCELNYTGALFNRYDFGTIQVEVAESNARSSFGFLTLAASIFMANLYAAFLG